MPSSVAFSMAHSMWSNLKTARRRWRGRAASDSSSSWRVKWTLFSETLVISARVEEASGDYVVDLAGFGAEDAGKVDGLVAGEGGGGGGPGVGDPTSAGHGSTLKLCGEVRAMVPMVHCYTLQQILPLRLRSGCGMTNKSSTPMRIVL